MPLACKLSDTSSTPLSLQTPLSRVRADFLLHLVTYLLLHLVTYLEQDRSMIWVPGLPGGINTCSSPGKGIPIGGSQLLSGLASANTGQLPHYQISQQYAGPGWHSVESDVICT
jgi:hypothetical protein